MKRENLNDDDDDDVCTICIINIRNEIVKKNYEQNCSICCVLIVRALVGSALHYRFHFLNLLRFVSRSSLSF